MIILSRDAVFAALPMPDAIRAVRWAYTAASRGLVVMPERLHLELPGAAGITLVMPALTPASPDGEFDSSLAVKTVSVITANPQKGLPTTLGEVLVLNPSTGEAVALLDAGALTAVRTGAGSAVATDTLANPDAGVLAMLGCGGQAFCQLEGVCSVRSIREVRLFSRNADHSKSLRNRISAASWAPPSIRIATCASEAIRNAEIICTATTSKSPLFAAEEVASGTHINAIGSFKPTMQEIPAEAVRQAKVFVDHLPAALSEAGDLTKPIMSGMISTRHVLGEIGKVLDGMIPGRKEPRDITLFKAVGMAAMDSVCAGYIVKQLELASQTSTKR